MFLYRVVSRYATRGEADLYVVERVEIEKKTEKRITLKSRERVANYNLQVPVAEFEARCLGYDRDNAIAAWRKHLEAKRADAQEELDHLNGLLSGTPPANGFED